MLFRLRSVVCRRIGTTTVVCILMAAFLLCWHVRYLVIAGEGSSHGMVRAIIGLLVTLALGSAQPNTSCVKVVNSTDASPYSDEEPSLTFTMDGVTNFTANSVSWSAAVKLVGYLFGVGEASFMCLRGMARTNHHWSLQLSTTT